MKTSLTLQVFLQHRWQDIAELVFNHHTLIEVTYVADYNFLHYLADNWQAFSINYFDYLPKRLKDWGLL